jgi:hypothetical protein
MLYIFFGGTTNPQGAAQQGELIEKLTVSKLKNLISFN